MATALDTTTTPAQTFNPAYVTGYEDLLNKAKTNNPNDYGLYNTLSGYGKMTDAYGNPLLDQQTLLDLTQTGNKAVYNPAYQKLDATKLAWAKDVLANDYIDPITNKPVQWASTAKGSTYDTELNKLLSNPQDNPRWTAQKTQAQTIAGKAVADAKTQEEAKIAADAKATADAKAAADATKLATDQDTANQLAQQTANDLKLKNATAPLDTKTLGGGFDTLGNPINSTIGAGINQDMIDKGMLNVAKVGAPTTIVNPNSAADVTKMVDAAKAAEVNVTPDSMVSNQLSGLLAKNNPYIQQAVNAANLQASRRGMLNTGAAAGFAQDAAIKAALPIAQQDALARQKANEANAQAQNQLITTGLGLKATSMDRQAQNDIQVQNWNAANKIAVDTSNTQAINTATNLFTTAMLNDKVNGASDARKNADQLYQLITSGNITIAQKAADAVIKQLESTQTLENEKQLAVFNNSMKMVNDQIAAQVQHTRDLLIGDLDATKQANLAVDTLTAQYNDTIQKYNLTPDMNATTKASLANVASMKYLSDVKDVYNRYAATSAIIKTSAGKTATNLVSPTK
jgi:hypothetical protein